jgi:DNA-binding transcriptional LysR family regulator
MEKTMDRRMLQVFREVVRQGSFTRAAEKLFIAQPAVSITIRKLEEELELTLLNRQEKQVTLTTEGERLLRHAELILTAFATAETEMAELRDLSHGEVRIGIPPMLSSYYFPRIIGAFRQLYPHLQLSVNGEGAANLLRMIRKGEIDMAVIAGAEVPDGLQGQHLLREEIVACVPAGHPLAGLAAVSLTAFMREPLILYQEGYFMRELMNKLIATSSEAPQVVFETNIFSMVRSLIRQGTGVSTFLRMVVSDDPDLTAISFDPPIHLDLQVAWKADRYLSRANRAFLEFLLQRGSDRPGSAT